jgi:hypothetical protein
VKTLLVFILTLLAALAAPLLLPLALAASDCQKVTVHFPDNTTRKCLLCNGVVRLCY